MRGGLMRDEINHFLQRPCQQIEFCFQWHFPVSIHIEAQWRIHVSVNKAILASGDGLLPPQCQAIIWTNAGLLMTGPVGTNLSGIGIKIHWSSLKKINLKMLSAKGCHFVFSLHVWIYETFLVSFNSLWPSDSTWQHRSRSTLAMAT